MPFSPTLSLANKATGEKAVYEIDQDRLKIGRDRSNYIVLNSRSVSRYHAQITKDANQFYVCDLKSSNGTFLNKKKLNLSPIFS